MKYIYLALLYARATEAHLHSMQLASTINRTQTSHTQVRLASLRPVSHCIQHHCKQAPLRLSLVALYESPVID